MCSCTPVFLTDRHLTTPVGPVVASACSCCGAPAGKKCAGMGAGSEPANKHHGPFKWADVCPDRLEVQGVMV